jgi:peptide/nickel transport system permease protein
MRHLLPAASGYLGTQATLLLPAFILAESTMSYVGLGFPDTTPTWGTMLQDASNVAMLSDAPWALAPAAAIFMVVLGVNLLVQSTGRAPVQLER